MINLYIVRHGETSFNRNRRMQGWADSPLTDEGVDIAKRLGIGLENTKFDVAYSSDLNRARYTRDYILESAKQNIDKYENQSIREMSFGIHEGEVIDTIWPTTPDGNLMKLPLLSRLELIEEDEGVETLDAFRKRIETGFKDIVEEARSRNQKNVLIVTHGVVISTFIKMIDGNVENQGSPDNASVSKVVVKDDDYTVDYYNNTSFIKG